MWTRVLSLVAGVVLVGVPAHALTVLTAGKHAVFRAQSALVHVGRDRELATLVDPTCDSGLASSFQLGTFLQSNARLTAAPAATLPCERWRRTRGGYVYRDDDGAAGGVRRISYGRDRLVIRLGGTGYAPPGGPVAYVETWLVIGETRLLARFHNFRVNGATRLVTRKTSSAAAAGEAAFWDVLLGDDLSEERQQAALAALGRASRKNKRDGRSQFLLAMMRLYRFGVRTPSYAAVSDAAKAEIRAADEAFAAAVPLLWDGTAGDSRVPGFAAAATFTRGFVDGDAALTEAGLRALDEAIRVNAFFNVFDLIPVISALPPSDPRFASAFEAVLRYLEDPETVSCVVSQVEICNNAGLAPRNLNGSMLLFGDVYAKGGRLQRAREWYTLSATFADPAYEFRSLAQARLADVDARVARYLDDDPANDDPVVGAGPENCATCHHR